MAFLGFLGLVIVVGPPSQDLVCRAESVVVFGIVDDDVVDFRGEVDSVLSPNEVPQPAAMVVVLVLGFVLGDLIALGFQEVINLSLRNGQFVALGSGFNETVEFPMDGSELAVFRNGDALDHLLRFFHDEVSSDFPRCPAVGQWLRLRLLCGFRRVLDLDVALME